MCLYELGLLVSQVMQIPGLFSTSAAVKQDLGNLYCDLVQLAGSISFYYRQRLNGLSNEHASIKFDAVFGKQVENIFVAKNKLYDRMWKQRLGNKHYAMSIHTVQHKLNPVSSGTFRGALYSELAEDLERAEDTCEWIKHDLAEFLRSSDKILGVTGPAGCGKTVLADWIEERLRRPLDHKSYTVLAYNFREFDLLLLQTV